MRTKGMITKEAFDKMTQMSDLIELAEAIGYPHNYMKWEFVDNEIREEIRNRSLKDIADYLSQIPYGYEYYRKVGLYYNDQGNSSKWICGDAKKAISLKEDLLKYIERLGIFDKEVSWCDIQDRIIDWKNNDPNGYYRQVGRFK